MVAAVACGERLESRVVENEPSKFTELEREEKKHSHFRTSDRLFSVKDGSHLSVDQAAHVIHSGTHVVKFTKARNDGP
ncbi:hypothetical protein RIF29_38917 [Crotalaria pallida]|uniref:Uncharacterized protein n=1 Tax=Crotalaria pallida TaxID=3830 RepID=A0AAN9E065_CROPI